VSPEALDFVGLATTTPPLAEEEFAPRVVRALGGASGTRTTTATASPLAGVDVLERAIEADGPALAIAADAPTGDPAEADHRLGAAAVAFLVDDDAPVTLVDSAAHADEYPGVRYRERGAEAVDALGVTTYERDAVGESIAAVLETLTADELVGAALHQPNGGLPYRVGGRTDLTNDAIERGTVVDRVGDAGPLRSRWGSARRSRRPMPTTRPSPSISAAVGPRSDSRSRADLITRQPSTRDSAGVKPSRTSGTSASADTLLTAKSPVAAPTSASPRGAGHSTDAIASSPVSVRPAVD